MTMRRLLLTLLLASGLLTGPAYAATGATLTASPDPVVFTDSNAAEEFTGCGYLPSTGVEIVVTTPEAVSFFGGPADAAGCIDISWNGFITTTGTYYVSSYQYVHNDRRASLMASTSFDVIGG